MSANIIPHNSSDALHDQDEEMANVDDISGPMSHPGPSSSQRSGQKHSADEQLNSPSKRQIITTELLTSVGTQTGTSAGTQTRETREDTPAQLPLAITQTTVPPPSNSAAAANELDPEDLRGSLDLLPVPHHGFPTIHGITQRDLFAVVGNETQGLWHAQTTPYVLAYIAHDKDVAQATTRVEKLTQLFRKVLDSESVFVGHAYPANRGSTDLKPLSPYFVGGITAEQKETLLRRVCWSTLSITAFTISDPVPPSCFIMSLENLPLPPTLDSEEVVINAVRRKILHTASIHNFIFGHRDNVPADLIYNDLIKFVADSIEVRSISVAHKGNPDKLTVFNVYGYPPTKDADGLELWVTKLRNMDYTCIYGTGKPRRIPFHCICCKARDHPTGLCPYSELPGWNNNGSITGPTHNRSAVKRSGRGRGTRGRGRGT